MPEDDYTIPFGVADVKREGEDATVVAIGGMVPQALEAGISLEDDGYDIEVIDPRTFVTTRCGEYLRIVPENRPGGRL